MSAGRSDRTLLLSLSAGMLVLIVGVSVLAPRRGDDDPTPSSYNTGPQGVKAAYLTLERMGRRVSRRTGPLPEWEQRLSDAEAAQTTLVLAEPVYDNTERKALAAAVQGLLRRGGRVVTTDNTGALLLGGEMKAAGLIGRGLCESTPEGPGALARAGSVEMTDDGQWGSAAPQYEVAQRCGDDAVVVRFAVPGAEGRTGEAVWWSSPTPMENAELKHDGDLRLLLASVGEGRTVVFDEGLRGGARTMWDAARGLPLAWLAAQAAAVFVLLVLSYSRRRGPVRAPVTLPRSSPVEFAESMGDLYEKGGASSAAIEAARRRLLRMLVLEAALPQAVTSAGPEAIAEALAERLGGEWDTLARHLEESQRHGEGAVTAGSALRLVRALRAEEDEVRRRLQPRTGRSAA